MVPYNNDPIFAVQAFPGSSAAYAMALRGAALRENPSVLELQIIERWDGITPLVVGPGATGANMMLPLGDFSTGTNPMAKEETK